MTMPCHGVLLAASASSVPVSSIVFDVQYYEVS